MRADGGGRGQRTARAVFRLARQVLTSPQSVGLGRMLGLVGLFAAGVQLLTWPFLGASSTSSPHGILIIATALGSFALLVAPVRMLTRSTSQAAFRLPLERELDFEPRRLSILMRQARHQR